MSELILRLITLDIARRREGNRGRTTQWRDRKTDPDYPQVVWRGNRPYLVEHEHTAYLEKLIERARSAAPDAGEPAAEPDVKHRRCVERGEPERHRRRSGSGP